MGDSVSTKVEGLTRSNDQKLELLRSGMEQRLDCFTTESGRKIDGLTQSVAASSGKLQDEVSVKLVEFKNSLEGTVKETHQLQREQTETIRRPSSPCSRMSTKDNCAADVIETKLSPRPTDQPEADGCRVGASQPCPATARGNRGGVQGSW